SQQASLFRLMLETKGDLNVHTHRLLQSRTPGVETHDGAGSLLQGMRARSHDHRTGEDARFPDQRLRLLHRHAHGRCPQAGRKRDTSLYAVGLAGILALHAKGARRARLDRSTDADLRNPRAGRGLPGADAALHREGSGGPDAPDRNDQLLEPHRHRLPLGTVERKEAASSVVFLNSPFFVIPGAHLRATRDPSRSSAIGPGSARLTPFVRDDKEVLNPIRAMLI